VGFEQAAIKVEKETEFAELRKAVERIFSPELAEKYLATLKSKDRRIRKFEQILEKGIFEKVDQELKRSGKKARDLYKTLTVPDQGQIRELYLSKVEQVAPELRTKFHIVYRDY